jgi:hypothetical protein
MQHLAVLKVLSDAEDEQLNPVLLAFSQVAHNFDRSRSSPKISSRRSPRAMIPGIDRLVCRRVAFQNQPRTLPANSLRGGRDTLLRSHAKS